MLFPPPTPSGNPPRVVVTGAGIITALGAGWEVNAAGLRAGRPAFRPVTLFDTRRQRARMAAEVDLPPSPPPTSLPAPKARRLDRATRLLLHAAAEAVQQSGWSGERPDIGLCVGTTSGGMNAGEEFFRQFQGGTARRHQPGRVVSYQCQTAGRRVADALDLGGPVWTISHACASGADAIGLAWEQLRRGETTRALAGGFDILSQFVFAGFDALQALSTTTCRPFDARRDGLSLGEGAGVLALETLASARARGAVILAELAGFGRAFDRHHIAQPHPEGDAALAAMQAACAAAGLRPAEIDYLNAHGTGTPLNDAAESRAIARWAGADAARIALSSTKASIGHTLGAAGAIEAVISVMVLREGWLPPEPFLDEIEPLCPCRVVRRPEDAGVNAVLSNSFGFGGANASLIFRRLG